MLERGHFCKVKFCNLCRDEVLEKLSKMFEMVIFTAGKKEYADKILDQIEGKNKYFKRRLYREDCI